VNKPVQIRKVTYFGTKIANSSMHGLVYGTRNQHTTLEWKRWRNWSSKVVDWEMLKLFLHFAITAATKRKSNSETIDLRESIYFLFVISVVRKRNKASR